jgi:hypothetical protein
MTAYSNLLIYFLVAAVVTVGAFIFSDGHPTNRAAVYQIECAPQGTSQDCAFVAGSVPTSIADTARSCSVFLPYCQAKYGTYGLGVSSKQTIHLAGSDGYDLLILVNRPRTYITSLHVRSSTEYSYIVWSERQNQADGGTKESVMFISRKLANDQREWSKPDTLLETSDTHIRALDVSVEETTSEHKGAASSAGLHVFISYANSLGSPGTNRHWVLRGGAVSTKANIDIGVTAYSQMEVVGDSLYLAFVGLMAAHTPARSTGMRSDDKNNVFVMSKHLSDNEWGRPRLIEDTGSGLAHYLTASAHGGDLRIGFTKEYDTSENTSYTQFSLSTETLTSKLYDLDGFVGAGTYIEMIRNESITLVEDRTPERSILHRLSLDDASFDPIDVRGPVLSSTFYILENEPVYTYARACPSKNPMICITTMNVREPNSSTNGR